MFVAIENEGMNAFHIDGWIKRTRDENAGKISPEFAMEVLSKTNHFANIKMLMKNINKLPDEEKKNYKDFVLACVDCREQTPETMEMLRSMADVCGVRDEFDELNAKPKFYNETDCGGITVNSDGDFYKAVGASKFYFYADDIHLDWRDLSDLEVRFKDNAKVNLSNSKNLPEDLDVSMCSKVDLSGCVLSKDRELKFREGAEVDLSGAYNLPENLDVSMCSKVDLSGCHLGKDRELKFREGAEVYLSKAENLPANLDVSMCSKVDLSKCDLGNICKLKFAEGGVVDLWRATNLPEKVDFSMCEEVYLEEVDLSMVKELKFRDEEQRDKFLENAEKFEGKIVYVGDKGKSKTMPVNNGGGMEM